MSMKNNMHRTQSIDPDLIKFYEAFKERRSLTKMPIKPSGVNLRDDLYRLKHITLGMKNTMKRVQIEMSH